MTRNILLLGLAGFVAAAVAVGALAQQQPAQPVQPGTVSSPQPQSAPAQQRPPTITTVTRRVVVPVTVKDDRGQLVGDLAKSEFRILVDNVEQKILGFSAEAVPLSAVVVLDNDLNERVADQVQKSLTTVAAGFGPSDEVALVTYEEFPTTVADFSSNNDALFTTLKRLQIGSHDQRVNAGPTGSTGGYGGAGPPPSNGAPIGSGPPPAASVQLHGSGRYKKQTALTDAVFAAGEMLKTRARDRRKIIFLVSDGINTNNEHSFDETLRSLLMSDVSVFSISVTRSLPVGKSLVQRGQSELEKYAVGTGGDTFYAGRQPELERLYSAVTEQARNEYTLTFSPEDVVKGKDYHPIEVRVRRPGLSVETRQGYYESGIAPGR